jgi:hypothetical protein
MVSHPQHDTTESAVPRPWLTMINRRWRFTKTPRFTRTSFETGRGSLAWPAIRWSSLASLSIDLHKLRRFGGVW